MCRKVKGKQMETNKLKELEKSAISVFGEKAVISVAQIRVANKGYAVKINIQGLPVEVSVIAKTVEQATEQAVCEINKRMRDACEKELFKTQPDDRYEIVKLTDYQLDTLFHSEELLGDEYRKELKEKTTAWMCQLNDKKYECVIECPYMNLHSRGVGPSKLNATMMAIWKAHEVFLPELIQIGKDLLKE